MSSILKALQKLEREKSTRTPEAVRIDAEILRDGAPSRRPPYLLYSSLVAVLFFVCGGALTYVSMKRDKVVPGAHSTATGSSSTDSAAPSLPRSQVLTVLPAAPHKAPIHKPGVQTAPLRTRPPKQASPLPPAARSATKTPPAASPAATRRPVTAAPQAPPSPAAPPAPTQGRMPALRVDGIAYHMGSAESLAVVNGVAVYAGATIEGARVEEIEKDRIRFSYGGEKFEVPLGKSSR